MVLVSVRTLLDKRNSLKMSATESPAAGKKGKKKSKGKTVSLNAFLSDSASGTNFVKDPPKAPATTNWADATEDFDPSEITTNWPGEKPPPDSIFDRSVLPSAPRAAQALQIDPRRLPKSPPYTVYLGNLSYECSEEDILRFFDRKKLSATSIRLPVESGTSRLRGFGYAEFGSLQDLMDALSLSGETLLNRPLQVDVASGGRGGGGGFDDMGGRGDRRRYDHFDDDRTAGDWRRGGDGDREMSPPYEGGGRRYGGGDSYDRRGPDDRFGRGPPGRSRGFGQGWGDRDGGGGGGGFYDDRRGGGDSYDRRDDYGGGRYRDDRYDRRDRPPRRGGGYGGGGGGRDYYDGDRGGFGGPRDYDRRRDDGPGERPRLILQPRSKPREDNATDEKKSASSSIFGGAKPVDTAAREKEIEERMIRDKEAEKERKEREAREQEEREKEREHDRAEKAARLFGGAKPVDTASREREIEEKLRREKEEFEKRLAEQAREERDDRGSSQERHREGSRDRDRVPRERRFSSRGDSSRERDSSDHHDDHDGGRRSNRRRSPLYQDRREGSGERGSTEDVRGRDSPYGKQSRYGGGGGGGRERGGSRQYQDRDRSGERGGYNRDRTRSDQERDRERDRPRRDRKDSHGRGDRDSREFDTGEREKTWERDNKDGDYERDRDGYRSRRRGEEDREKRGSRSGESRGQGSHSRGRGQRRQSDREGDERGGPRGGGGGRGTKEREGESKDGGGQRRQRGGGNAWSKGRPRILSNEGQMKKFEEPQAPTFSRPSRFAALQQDADDNDDRILSPDDEVKGQRREVEPRSPLED